MKIVLCVAFYEHDRIKGFLEGLFRSKVKENNLQIVTLSTGKALNLDEVVRTPVGFNRRSHGVEAKKRPYSQVMYEKIKVASQYCGNDDIYWNSDDDYAFNPHWVDFALRVFQNHKEINYFSLLKVQHKADRIKKHGPFKLGTRHSSMGGSFGARWKVFKPHMDEWFKLHNVTSEDPGTGGMFDQQFWEFLQEKTGALDNVWFPMNFSLIQHCNLVSNYVKARKNKISHMYGEAFDPWCDPRSLF